MENEEAEGIAPEEIVIAVGWLNWRAVEKPAPVYPVLVEKARLGGKAVVEVLLDTSGNVERAVVQSGHPVVYPAVLEAARQAKFYPTRVNGQLVKVSGFLTYDLGAG
jgi:protein TonB